MAAVLSRLARHPDADPTLAGFLHTEATPALEDIAANGSTASLRGSANGLLEDIKNTGS